MFVFLFLVIAAVILFGIFREKQVRAERRSIDALSKLNEVINEDRVIKGSIVSNSDGSISLCEGKGNRVTLIGASQQIATELKDLCDNQEMPFYDISKKISLILMKNKLQIKEVDKFLFEVRPIVENRVNNLISKDDEWDSLGERDKEDKKKEYYLRSMVEFGDDVTPAMSEALSFLTFNEPEQIPCMDELIAEYGMENINTYCQYYGRKNPIISIPEVNYRKPLEDLVKIGLAFSGKDMSVEELLSTLTLAELNELSLSETKFTRKDKAIRFLAEKENIASVIEKNITLRALFSLNQLPEKFKAFNVEKYKNLRYYYENMADVLVSLYRGYSPLDFK